MSHDSVSSAYSIKFLFLTRSGIYQATEYSTGGPTMAATNRENGVGKVVAVRSWFLFWVVMRICKWPCHPTGCHWMTGPI